MLDQLPTFDAVYSTFRSQRSGGDEAAHAAAAETAIALERKLRGIQLVAAREAADRLPHGIARGPSPAGSIQDIPDALGSSYGSMSGVGPTSPAEGLMANIQSSVFGHLRGFQDHHSEGASVSDDGGSTDFEG